MDMALEMGSSVANLGANVASSSTRPDGSFCVVPPGSSYMSSSSMWTSGILGGGGNTQQQHSKSHVRTNPQQQQQQQQGMAGVRSRANHLQSFLGRDSTQPPSSSSSNAQTSSPPTRTAALVQPTQQQGVQITPNASLLDQSWWGGGQGSILASSAIAAATPNHRPSPHSGSNNMNENATSGASRQVTAASSTNSKQLMQLMDSLNRLGNENAQLMREVEDAKAARAEAKAAHDMMAKFKNEYGQRFNKVKEALTKYNPQTNGAGGANNPVANRYVCALNLVCLLVCKMLLLPVNAHSHTTHLYLT